MRASRGCLLGVACIVWAAGCYASHERDTGASAARIDASVTRIDAGAAGSCRGLAGTVCRAAVSDCDVAETCGGGVTSCPPDGFAPRGEECAMGWCDGCGGCHFDSCIEGAVCDTGNPCEIGEVDCSVCDRPTCVLPRPLPAGTRCSDGDGCTDGEACTVDGRCTGGRVICE